MYAVQCAYEYPWTEQNLLLNSQSHIGPQDNRNTHTATWKYTNTNGFGISCAMVDSCVSSTSLLLPFHFAGLRSGRSVIGCSHWIRTHSGRHIKRPHSRIFFCLFVCVRCPCYDYECELGLNEQHMLICIGRYMHEYDLHKQHRKKTKTIKNTILKATASQTFGPLQRSYGGWNWGHSL